MQDLVFRPTQFNKCLLGITLPLDKDRFFRELEPNNPKDYVKCFEKKESIRGLRSWETVLWNKYEKNIVTTIRRIQSEVENSGVTVITDFALSHLRLIENFDVVTIIGHWLDSREKIELADNLYSSMEFIDAIPQNTECMLDLTVCNSILLLDEIKKYRKDIIVFGYTTHISVYIALLTYRCIIHEMNNNKSLNYLDATELAKTKINNYYKK
jgi:hypothetical protein